MRRRALLMLITLGLTAFGAPVEAASRQVMTFTGTASFGRTFSSPCTQTGQGVPSGEGLYLVGTPSDWARSRYGAWQLSTSILGTGDALDLGVIGVFDGTLDVCGYLDRLPGTGVVTFPGAPSDGGGIGAACGAMKGHDGMGRIDLTEVVTGLSDRHDLYEVGWKIDVAGTLVMVGRTPFGTLLGQAQMQGGSSCLAPNGATSFAIWGVWAIVAGPAITWNQVAPKQGDDAKSCDGASCPQPSSDPTAVPTAEPVDNDPPPAPTMVSPADGATFSQGASRSFTINATDPEGDDWFGCIYVLDSAGTRVRGFGTPRAVSGADSTTVDTMTLPAGTYRWRAQACDHGSATCGPFGADRTFTIV